MDTNTNIWTVLEHLATQWYENAKDFDGYEATTPEGDSLRLLLTLQRMNNGDLSLTTMAVKDFIRTIPPSELMRPEDLETINGIPTTVFPVASITVHRGESH